MAKITLNGNPFNTFGKLPGLGSNAPDFKLTRIDFADARYMDFTKKKVLMNIFPSIDTPVCAVSVRTLNERASSLDNTVVLCISQDLPFALKRFCGAQGLEKVIPLSSFRSTFGKDYGVEIVDGPLAGLCSRAIVILDEAGTVIHTEQVPEIGQEPNYDAMVLALESN